MEQFQNGGNSMKPNICSSKGELENHDSDQLALHSKFYDNNPKGICKKKRKFLESIDRCIDFMKKKQIERAIEECKFLISQKLFLEVKIFQGLGFLEHWKGYYSNGPHEWMMNQLDKNRIQGNPFDLLCVCFMIQLHDKQGNFEQMIKYYDQLDHPNRSEIYCGLGNMYYFNHQYYQAEKQYLKIIQEHSNRAHVYQYLSWIKGYWFQQKELSVYYCQKCLELDSQNVGALFNKALSLQTQEERMNALQQILVKHPKYCRIYVSLGDQQKDFEEKIKLYEKSIQKDPSYTIAYIKIGIAYFALRKDTDTCKQWLLIALQKNAEDYLVFYAWGEIESKQSNCEALKQYERCLQFNPYHFQSYNEIAVIYRLKNQIQNAIKYYLKYIELNPYNCDVFNYLGLAYDEIDKKQEAIEYYKKALQIDGQFCESLSNLGLSYQQQQNFEEALIYYERAHKNKPDYGGICYGIAICHFGMKRYDEAEKWAQLCVDKGGDDDQEVYQFLGDIQQKLGNNLKSLKHYLKHACVSKSLNTNYIMKVLLQEIERNEAINICHAAFAQIVVEYDASYSFFQLGKLYIQLQEFESAMQCFRSLRKLKRFDNYITLEVKRELKAVFGDPSMGLWGILDRPKLQKLKKEYYQLFRERYEGMIEEE